MEWQHQNEASIHRTAEEFTDNFKCIREWCQCYSTLKGQTRGVLGKHCCLLCGQSLSVDLDHRVSGRQEKQRPIGVEPASVTVCNYNQASNTGPSEIGTQHNRPLYKGPFLRSQIIGFPIVIIHFEPPRRGQPLYKGHNS